MRWFGFANRLLNFTFDDIAPLNGPSFQLHGGGGLPQYKGLHPVLNLQVVSTGCALDNTSCPQWNLGVSWKVGAPDPACVDSDTCWALGPAMVNGRLDGWNDWVIRWVGSPSPALGSVQVWRNGVVVLPRTAVATAYNDTVAP